MDKITAVIMCVFMFYAGYKSFNVLNPEVEPEIKPCKCVTYSQYALWQAKYDMYVDKNKLDSVAKYAELLNQIK